MPSPPFSGSPIAYRASSSPPPHPTHKIFPKPPPHPLPPPSPHRAAWASLELDEGQLGAARELLDEGLALAPNHAPSLLALARLERMSGDLQGAHDALEKLGKVRGGDEEGQWFLAFLS